MKLLLAALISTLAASSAAAAGAQLALPGEAFHGDEVPARHGETWLALVVEGDSARLQSSVVTVKAVEDPLLDEAGQTSGRSVAVPGLQPLVLLRGIAPLKPGPVPQALALAQARPLAPNENIVLVLGERRWTLSNRCRRIEGDSKAEDKRAHLDCTLVLDNGHAVQELAPGGQSYFEDGEEAASEAQLLFAGDLDHDGQVDLLLDTSDHYNLDRPTLFLSGQRKDGQLRQVAQQELTGC